MPVIMRRFEFDSAHRVLGHESKCRFLHGHRYVAEVFLDAPDLDRLGRVIDFGKVKEVVGSWIDGNWDHNALFHPEDPFIQIHQIETYPEHEAGDWGVVKRRELYGGREPYIMKYGNPTAEQIAKELFEAAADRLAAVEGYDKVRVVRVVIWETPNCWAECTGIPLPPVMNGSETERFFREAPKGAEAVTSLPPQALRDAAKRVRLGDRGLAFTAAPDGRTGKLKVVLTDPPKDPMSDQEQIAHGIHPSQTEDESDPPMKWDQFTVDNRMSKEVDLRDCLEQAPVGTIVPTIWKAHQLGRFRDLLEKETGLHVSIGTDSARDNGNGAWIEITARPDQNATDLDALIDALKQEPGLYVEKALERIGERPPGTVVRVGMTPDCRDLVGIPHREPGSRFGWVLKDFKFARNRGGVHCRNKCESLGLIEKRAAEV